MCCPRKPYTHTQHTAYTHRACHSRSQNPCVSYFWCVFPPRLDRDGRAQRSFSLQVPDNLSSSGTMSRNPGDLQCHTPAGDRGTPRPCCAQTPMGAELRPCRPPIPVPVPGPQLPGRPRRRRSPVPPRPGGAAANGAAGRGAGHSRCPARDGLGPARLCAGPPSHWRCGAGPGPHRLSWSRRSRSRRRAGRGSGPRRAASTGTQVSRGRRAPARPLVAVPTLPGTGVTAGQRRFGVGRTGGTCGRSRCRQRSDSDTRGL